jgi:aminoglycoside phosphotransferase (APT) family kinase protein
MSRPDPDEMATRLAAFLAREEGLTEAAVAVADLRRLAGGSSREIWAFGAQLDRREAEPEVYDLVLRKDPPGRDEGERGLEFRVVRTAFEAGVPVPEPRWFCVDPGVLGSAFYVMDRVEGEALPRRLLRDDRYAKTREVLIPQMAQALVAIHAIDPDLPALNGLADPSREGPPAEVELERVLAGIRELAPQPHPVLELAYRWLRERLPSTTRRALVHGDFRIGNVMFDEQGLRGVLDWELCKIGDPVEDLGWVCTRAWRFGSDKPAGGIGSREELLSAYAAAGGFEVDPADLLFWEALGTFKVALVFIQQAWVYLSGRYPSLELAAIGRRTAEAEDELLRLMEEGA